MTLNGSGFRDTARVLRVTPATVIDKLKDYKGRQFAFVYKTNEVLTYYLFPVGLSKEKATAV